MPTSSFYNDNMFRTYPLVTNERSHMFPKKRIVGIKVCCSFDSPFRSFPQVSLIDWTVRNTEHRVTFSVKADDVRVLVPVTIPKATSKFAHVFSELIQNISIRLTVGDLVGESDTYSDLDMLIEPTLVLWLRHRGIRSVRIGNASRERLAVVFEGLSSRQKRAYADGTWWRQETTLTGPLLFSEGYNCRLVAAVSENTLRFFPQAGSGMGETTEFVSLGMTLIDGRSIQEYPQDMSVRPDGLPHADRLLFSFCGTVGPEIKIKPTETIDVRNEELSVISVQVASLGSREC